MLSLTPRASADTTRQRYTGPSGAPAQHLGIYERFAGARVAMRDLIENTAWTSNSLLAQQSLLQTVNTMAAIPDNIVKLSSGEKAAVEGYILVLEHVLQRLTAASVKYGRNDARKRDKVISSWAHLDRTGGIQVLDTCQAEIETAAERFLNFHETRLNNAPPQKVQSSSQYGQAKSKSGLSTKLVIAKTTFNTVEAVSGAIPLVGTYIGAAAKVGSMIVDMWKGMDSNEEAAKSLESHMSTLAEHLEYFKQLKLVEEEIQGLKSKDAFTRAFISGNNAETLKGFQEDIKTIQDEIHGLVILDTNTLLNKLYHATEQNMKKLRMFHCIFGSGLL
ncbi:hypothetical protein FRC00_000327 [Tulasnella sp. 408]|nr:hypothetical protein FRC00_000327 [Tulasnella sp. 408]